MTTVLLALLALALCVTPVVAQEAFVTADLAGTWRILVLSGSGDGLTRGSTQRGSIQFDATGAVIGGTIATGGQLTVTADGLVAGTLTSGSGDTLQTATIVEARLVRDRRIVVGVIQGGDLGDVAGADFGLVVLVRTRPGDGTTADLTGTWRYHELGTPLLSGAPHRAVGEVTFGATPGLVSGGTLLVPGDVTVSLTGDSLAVAADGGVSGTLRELLTDWQLTGQISSPGDWLAAAASSAGSLGVEGIALMSRVPAGASFAITDLAGAWRAYAVALDGVLGGKGTFLRGVLTVDGAGGTSGQLRDPAGAPTDLTGGTLDVDATSGQVTGSLTGAGVTLTLDGTLRGARDLTSAVATLTTVSGTSRALIALVPVVTAVRFNRSAYTVLEGASAQITLARDGDTSGALALSLRGVGERFGNQSFPVAFAAGAATVTVAVPTVDDTLAGGDTVALSLEDVPPDLLRGPPATLTINDNEAAGVIRFAAATVSVSEGLNATVQVLRAGTRLGGDVTVGWEIIGGTATAGDDFTLAASGTLTFGPGVTTQPLVIPTVEDLIAEGPETIVLRLHDPSRGATLGTPSQVTVTITDDDVAGSVQFAAATARVAENAGPALLTVTRTGGAAGGVTIDYESSDGTARAGADYTAVAGTLTFEPGITAQTIAVPLVDTALAEGDRTVRVTLRNPGGRGVLGALRETVLTILDDEIGFLFNATGYSVAENGGGATITVLRTGPAVGVASVTYSTGDGTAQAGADYTPTSGRLVFQAAERSKTFRVPVLEDGLVEDGETVLLALSNPEGALLGSTNTSVLTIVDNDRGGTIQFAVAALTVSESLLSATVLVNRINGLAGGVTVDYATSDGSALAGQDYGETTGTLTFAANERSKTILVPLLNDRLVEGNETLQVSLSNPTGGATLGTPTQAVVTLADDDNGGVIKLSAATLRVSEPDNSPSVLATITVQRTGTNLAAGVSVQYATSDGTAVAGGFDPDYVAAAGQIVFGPGETTKTIQVTILGDASVEADETLLVTLSDPQGGATLAQPSVMTLTIVDPLASVQFDRPEYTVEERAGTVTLTLVRSGPTTGTATVRYATADIADGEPPAGHALVGVDYRAATGLITFRPGESRKTITVPIVLDLAAEDSESFKVELSEPQNVMLGTNTPALVTILDNARPGVVQFTAAASAVREGTAAVVTVTRTEGLDGVVTVPWTASGVTATAGADFTPAAGILTFTAGAASRAITLTTVNDTLAEGDETLTLQLGNVSGNAVLGPQATHALTIQDNDVAGTLELSADGYSVSEGGLALVTVRRTVGAASGVTVRYATEDLVAGAGAATAGLDYTAVTSVLTFAAGEMVKTFTVATLADGEPESDEAFRVTLSEAQPAGFAVFGARTAATVTIVDRQSRLGFRDAVVRATEGQTATVTVTRTGSLVGAVTVAYATTPGTAVEGADYTPATGVLTFGAGVTSRTFTVATLANGAVDGVRTVALTLGGPAGASLGVAVAELRIEDDERAGTLQFGQAGYSVVEGGVAQLVVTRTAGANGLVSAQYEVLAESTATGGGVDYTLAAGTVALEAGSTSAPIAVPTVADGLPEGTETVVVRLTAADGGAVLGAVTTTTLFIVDQEQTIAFGAAAFTVGETEPQAVVTVVRSGLPTGALTVTARTDGGTATAGLDYLPVNVTLTFAAGEILKTVVVPIPAGAAARTGNRTVGLVLEGDPGVVVAPATAELTILDFRPDLVVIAVATPTAALSGKILNAPMSVRNAGRVMSPPFQVGVFLARNDIPGATLPGAGTLLALESVRALMPSEALQLTTLLDLADDLPSGSYFVSAVADFGQAVGEIDEGNNGLASAPRTIQISRGLGKLTSASATLAQGDPAPAGARAPRMPAVDTGGCDAVGQISLTGTFQITSQIGSAAQAVARLTGTLMDQAVMYEFALDLTIGDDNSVVGSFLITSISGAFSGTGSGSFTGSLVDRALIGDISGTINTSTPRVCDFTGTLQATGDVSFFFNLEQRARGGVFGTAATPELALPVAVDEYLAAFRVLFDADFPAPAVVAFTGPASAGATNVPASGRRSELDADGAAATYVMPPVTRAAGGPGGAWSVLYKGAPRPFTVPDPGTSGRLVLAIPTVVVDPAGLLTSVSWTWADRTGLPMDPPAFVGRVRVRLTPNVGVSPLFESPALPRGNTSHTLALPVFWEDVAELAMIYQDTVTGHEYRVAYPRMHRAYAELETAHAVDKAGARDAQTLTLSFVAPVGVVDPATPNAVAVGGEAVPFQGRTTQAGQPVDVFRRTLDVTGAPPALGIPVTFVVTPIAGPPRVLATSLRNQGTNQSIEITSPTGTLESDAMLGVRRQVTWTLPAPALLGGFDVDTVTLSGLVRAADAVNVCEAVADQELGPDATLGFVTLPATCAGQPVDSSMVCVTVLGTGGEQSKACQTFGPDDMVVELLKGYSVAEGGTAVVSVSRRRGPTRKAASVGYMTTADGTAVAGVDFVPAAGTLTFAPGVTEQTFTVGTLADALSEGTRTVNLRLHTPGPGVVIGLNDRLLSITDDEQAGAIFFAQPAFSVTEGSGASLAIGRKGMNLAAGVTVDYQVVGGSAVNGADYTLVDGTLTFAAGQATHAIPVPTTQDTRAQGTRTVVVRLVNPQPAPRATVAASDATLSILDDENGGVIQFSQTGFKLTEAAGTLNLLVSRTGLRLGGNVTVDYRVATGTTAVAGQDFVLAAGTLTFAANQTLLSIPVSLLDDAFADRAKTLVVELLNPRGGNAALGAGSRATIAVADNEQEVQFTTTSVQVPEGGSVTLTVTRTGPLTGTATVNYATANGTATGAPLLPVPPPDTFDYVSVSGTLTFLPGVASRTLTIATRQDTVGEGDQTFFVSLGAPSAGVVLGPQSLVTITILDDEQVVRFASSSAVVTEGSVATITVQRAGPSNTRTLVDYATPATTADFFQASGTLTFEPGVTSRTFSVITRANTLDDGTRSASLSLSNARAVSSIIFLPPVPITITRTSTILFITDDDAGGTIQFAAAGASFSENQPLLPFPFVGRRPATLSVTRTGTNLASGVTVDYAVIGGTAINGTHYTLASGTLAFIATQTSASISIPLIDNTAADHDRTVVVRLSNPQGGGVLGTTQQATLTITDDEQELQFSSTGYAVLEGTAATITVTRTGPSGGTALVSYATSGGTATPKIDYLPVSGVLTFGPGITSRTISVPTFQNTVDDTTTQTVGLQLSSPSPTGFGGAVLGPRATTTLTIADDDQGGTVRFEPTAVSVVEGGTATLTVLRSGTNLASAVTVGYQVVGGTGVNGIDYLLPAGTLSFGAGQTSQTITVPTGTNTLVDGTRTAIVRLVSFTGGAVAALPSPQQVTLSITDDDQGGTIQFSPTTFSTSEDRLIVIPPFTLRTPAPMTVTRTGTNLASGVTVGYRVAGGTAVNGTDYSLATGTLTFGAGQTSATISVTIIDNSLIDGDRTLTVELFTVAGGGALGASRFGTLTILDDEQSVQFSSSGYSLSEGGVATITVRRSGPRTTQATVQYATIAGGTATAGSDYVTTSGTLTFPPNVMDVTFPVVTVEDALFEGNQTIRLQLSNPSAPVLLGPRSQATLTIVDDEQRVRFSTTSYTVSEGGTVNVLVLREGPTTGTVTVDYETITGTAGTADFKPVSGRLTFGPGLTSAVIAIRTNTDANPFESAETFGVRLFNPSPGLLLGTNLTVVTIN